MNDSPGSVPGPIVAARGIGRHVPAASNWLFRDIRFEVGPGDQVSLVGPTGSGKSLVLRAVALLDRIDEGEVTWRGRTIPDASVPEFRREVLYLQQRATVIEGTVEDNLRLPFRLAARSETAFPAQRALELLESLGRDRAFLTLRTDNLSGGERQLVALLRAVLAGPTILLLDEPSASLDSETTAALEHLVEGWFTEAPAERAYIWVSHDADQARRVAERTLRMEQGELRSE